MKWSERNKQADLPLAPASENRPSSVEVSTKDFIAGVAKFKSQGARVEAIDVIRNGYRLELFWS